MLRVKGKIITGLLLASVLTLTTAATSSVQVLQTNFSGKGVPYTIKVNVKDALEMGHYAKILQKQGYDVAGYNWRKGEIQVITDSFGIEKLNQNHLQGYTLEQNELGLDQRYLNPAKTEQKLKDLNAKYPHLTKLEQIGTSIHGRAIWALLVSTTPQTETADYAAKPSIVFDGMHHAREVMTSEVVMDVAEYALDSIENNSADAEMLKRWNIWIVPMLNVDGNNLVWTKSSFWRKNAHSDSSGTYGVDINRNYPFNWNRCNGASNSKFNDAYRGTAGASEPETQALMKLAEEVRPTASLSYHSFSELVLYPYGCNGVLTGDNALVSSVANELAAMLPSDSGHGNYDPGTPWQLLYDVDGDSMSYLHGEFGSLAITFEINQQFQPNYDVKVPTVAKHRKAWLYFLSRLEKGLLSLKVVDARTNDVVPAQIGISNLQLVQGEKPFKTNSAGYFFKVLNAGDYTLTIQLADGRTQTVQVKMDSAPQNLTVVVN
jgi:hypothetical protein